ncbi:MAG TPA: hypothetical protein VGO11_26880 [Chthoniobacteraceae bacterium]|nr:hypothetical protein [Chthoniobacteraceae bacterium]
MIVLFFAGQGLPADEPSGQPVPSAQEMELVKGVVVTGTIKKVVGSFATEGHQPGAGDTFRIDLANLPKEHIALVRAPDAAGGKLGGMPFGGALAFQRIRFDEKHGRAVVDVAASEAASDFRFQVLAPSLKKGSKVLMLFYQSGYFIGGMAEAEGVVE